MLLWDFNRLKQFFPLMFAHFMLQGRVCFYSKASHVSHSYDLYQSRSGMVMGWVAVLLFLLFFWGRSCSFKIASCFLCLGYFLFNSFLFTSGPRLLGCDWLFVKPGFTCIKLANCTTYSIVWKKKVFKMMSILNALCPYYLHDKLG